MKHYIIYPLVVPSVGGDSSWEAPQDFLTEVDYLQTRNDLPIEYIQYESNYVDAFYSICEELFTGEIETYFLYVDDKDDEDTELKKLQHEFLFRTSGFVESEINELVSSGKVAVQDLKIYTKLALRALGGFCFIDKASGFVASSTNTGQNLFVSLPWDYDLNVHLSGRNLVYEESLNLREIE